MADTNDEIIELTNLIERGPAHPSTPPRQQATSAPEPLEAEQAPYQESAMNENPQQQSEPEPEPDPGLDSEEDLDLLMTQLEKGGSQSLGGKKEEIKKEMLDMTGLDEAENLLGNLQMHDRDYVPEKKPTSLDSLLEAGGSEETEKKDDGKKAAPGKPEPQKPAQAAPAVEKQAARPVTPAPSPAQDPIQESVDNDLNDLLAAIDAEAAEQDAQKSEARADKPAPESRKDDADLDSLLDEMDHELQAKEKTPAGTRPEETKAGAKDDTEPDPFDLDSLFADAFDEAKGGPVTAPAAGTKSEVPGEPQKEQAPKKAPSRTPDPVPADMDDIFADAFDEAKGGPVTAPAAGTKSEVPGEPQKEEAPKKAPSRTPDPVPADMDDIFADAFDEAKGGPVTAPAAGTKSEVPGEPQKEEAPKKAPSRTPDPVPADMAERDSAEKDLFDRRVASLEDRLRDMQGLSERIQSLEENLSTLKGTLTDSISSVREECANLFSPDRLLAEDGPIAGHIASSLSALEKSLTAKNDDVVSRLDAMNAHMEALEASKAALEEKLEKMGEKTGGLTPDAIGTLVDEKLASMSQGVTRDELEESLATIRREAEDSRTQLENSIEAVSSELKDIQGKEETPSLDAIETMLDRKVASMPSGITEGDLESRLDRFLALIEEKLASIASMSAGITKDDLEARLSQILEATETIQTNLAGRIDAIQERMQALAAQETAPALDALRDSLKASLEESLKAMLDEKLATLPLGITKEDLEERIVDVVAANESTRNEMKDSIGQLAGLRESLETTIRAMLDEQMAELPHGISFDELKSHLAPITEAVNELSTSFANAFSRDDMEKLLDEKLAALPAPTGGDLEERLAELRAANEAWQENITRELHDMAEQSSAPDLSAFKESLQASLLAQLTLAFKPLLDEQIAAMPKGIDQNELDARLSPLEDAITSLTTIISQGEKPTALADIDALLDEKLGQRINPLLAREDDLASRIEGLAEKLKDIATLADADDLAALEDKLDSMLERRLGSVNPGLTGEELEARLAPVEAAIRDLPKERPLPANEIRRILEDRVTPILNATEQAQADFVTLFDALNKKIEELADTQPTAEDIERFLDQKLATMDGQGMPKDLADRLDDLTERIEAYSGLEDITRTVRETSEKNAESFAAVEQKIDTLSGNLSATENRMRLNLEKQQREDTAAFDRALASVEREREIFSARVDSLEKRIDALEPTFNARIDKAAAGATARILREELRQILG